MTAEARSITADELAARDRATIIHPYMPSSVTERVVMVEGDGCRLHDADGKEYLDATGGLWLAHVGHGRQDLAEVARRQMERLEYFTSFWEFTNDQAIALAERLLQISPERQAHVYFTSGGSEGNEAALRMARYYHHRRGDTDRTWFLARHKGYHGVGYGSGTVTGFPAYHDGFRPVLPDVHHLTPPWPYRKELFDGQDPTDFCIAELERTIDEIGAGRIAAFIGEPIMGVAGMIVPPDDYWPRVAELLDRHGILLIYDEVVTAYGRTGSWFAAQHFGIQPDIIVTAKGITSGYMPLGAVLVSDAVAEAVTAESGFPIGYTYNGHPTSCAVALANLAIVEQENLLERAKDIGARLLAGFESLRDIEIVGDVRGVGMMAAVELVADRDTREPLSMQERPQDVIRRESGVIVRDCAHNLVVSPPLVMTESEADEVVAAMRSVLERTDAAGHIRPAV